MRKLLTSPVNMSLSTLENQIYQNALKYVADLSLNLMAIKVENHPEDFLNWCNELRYLCANKLNIELLDPEQFKPLKKLEETLILGISTSQLRMMRISPWPIFENFIKDQSEKQSLNERLALLDYVESINTTPLCEMIEEDRLTFAGKHTAKHEPSLYNFDVEWFANTKGAKVFHKLLHDHTSEFDDALNFIPLTGEITYSDYQKFVSAYIAIFSAHTEKDKAPLTPATRLLAMRRPDYFVALNNNKIDAICQGLGIPKLTNVSYDDYWQELLATLKGCMWWQSPKPDDNDSIEYKLWKNRMVMVDLFFFAQENQAENSNYVRMRDKPKQIKIGVARSTKRTKESAEALVDKALANDDMPEFLVNLRGSIIKSVENGKSVEQAISLMRSIFS